MNKYILENPWQTEIEASRHGEFIVNFQRAILLSLLESHRLTQQQFCACLDKVMQTYSTNAFS